MIAVVNDWWHHMVRGEFADAWRVSDAILRQRRGEPCWHLPRHEQYVWDGRPLHGARVLVRCYHGLGDTIQFIRYAPLVQRIAREVIVWAQPALVPLLRGARAVDRLLPLHDGTPNCDFDVDVESMELAHVFRTTIDTIPRDVPYLHAPPLDVAALRPDASRIRVGIFWRVGDWDDRRSVPYSLLPKLADISGVDLYMVARDHECAAGTIPVTALPYPDDIYGTARIMRTLDLVITADSMPAHLAGALGVPTWTLLHARPDWRWMQDRDDSPWYPTMRLFHQQRAGDWDAVIDRVALALGRARVSCASAVRPR